MSGQVRDGGTIRYPYEDAGLGIEQRVDDLMARLELADKIGLLFHPYGFISDPEQPDPYQRPPMAERLRDRRIRAFLCQGTPGSAREMAAWANAVQRIAAEHPLRIPVTLGSDPRHSVTDNPLSSNVAGSAFSRWPEPIGIGATGSAETARAFGDAVRREYAAGGLTYACHPQIDLTTEPRWARIAQCFGEDADLTCELVTAFIEGLNGPDPTHSVAAVPKHFPGGGPQQGGRDPHFRDGQDQVYPGGRFDYHLQPFVAALEAGATWMMPYYGKPVGTEFEEVGFAFNRDVIAGILRGRLGFDGVVVTDFGVVTGYHPEFFPAKAWGVEELTAAERVARILEAGCDQFGGESGTELLAEALASGLVTENRVDESVRRVLREKFRVGLFDERRYVDEDAAEVVLGSPELRAAGIRAQQQSLTLLRNDGLLPLARGAKVYAEGIDATAFEGYAVVVADPADADVAVVRKPAPTYADPARGFLGSLHKGRLDYPAEEVDRLNGLFARVPSVLDVFLERPAILTGLEPAVLIGSYGTDDRPFVQVLFGEAPAKGRLPFDLPSSMAAVEASREDVPFDTVDPLYRFGTGLSWPAI